MESEKPELVFYSLFMLGANYELPPFSLLGPFHWCRNQHLTYQWKVSRAHFFPFKKVRAAFACVCPSGTSVHQDFSQTLDRF